MTEYTKPALPQRTHGFDAEPLYTAEQMRAYAADRIEAQAARMAELLREREALSLMVSDLQSALEYHQEQTRPIHSTRNAILAARAALAPKESA